MCRPEKVSQSSRRQSPPPGGAWRLGWVPWRVLGPRSTTSRAASALPALRTHSEVTCAPKAAAWIQEQPALALARARMRMRGGHRAGRDSATAARWVLRGALTLHRSNWRPRRTGQRFSPPSGRTHRSPLVPRHRQVMVGTDSLPDPATGRGPCRCHPQSRTRAWGRRREPPSRAGLRAAL